MNKYNFGERVKILFLGYKRDDEAQETRYFTLKERGLLLLGFKQYREVVNTLQPLFDYSWDDIGSPEITALLAKRGRRNPVKRLKRNLEKARKYGKINHIKKYGAAIALYECGMLKKVRFVMHHWLGRSVIDAEACPF